MTTQTEVIQAAKTLERNRQTQVAEQFLAEINHPGGMEYSQQNFSTVTENLKSLFGDSPEAFNVRNLHVAHNDARARGLLKLRPLPAPPIPAPAPVAAETVAPRITDAEKEANDRFEGRLGNAASRRDSSRSTKTEQDQAREWLDSQMEMISDPVGAKKKADAQRAQQAQSVKTQQESILETMPIDCDVAQMTSDQRRQFRSLDPEQIRKWTRRRELYLRQNPPSRD